MDIDENLQRSFGYIFVVDDDLFLNELFCHFLENKGFKAFGVDSVMDARVALRDDLPIDLILLDYNLGDGTGLEFLRHLQQEKGDAVPPIIMISTNDSPTFLESCFSAGVADYIIKPVNLSLLALKVGTLLHSVNLQRVISRQNLELAHFKQEAEREEAVAKFTYEYLLKQNNQLIDGVDIWLKPSASFSGDIAVAKVSPSGDLYFLLADATGHGLSAAITIMPVVSIFNTMVAKGFDIQSIVIEMNRKLERDTPHDRFVAAVVLHIQQSQNEIHIWNGGMPTAYWVMNGNIIREFKSRHMALGILDDNLFDANVETWRFPDRGYFFSCSDGLLEQVNRQGECFSKNRLIDVIHLNPPNIPGALISELTTYADTEIYSDDVSICTITPEKIPAGGYCLLEENTLNGCGDDTQSNFYWKVRICGKKLSRCELPPLCNKFLQYVGVDQSLCQIIFVVISEMVSNALDHGILRLQSGMKEEEDGFVRYFQERERRMEKLSETDAIELTLRREKTELGTYLIVTVEDTGLGYDFCGPSTRRDNLLSGRGLQMIKNLAKHVEIFPPGNRIEAVINAH